jgi:nucleotide-binding universal stress UspA family protein
MALSGENQAVTVRLIHVVPPGAGQVGQLRAEQIFTHVMEGIEFESVDKYAVEGSDIANTILRYAQGPSLEEAYDLIVIGATNEPLFKNLLVGNLSEKVAKEAHVTVVVVKRRSSRLHSFLRQTVLEPSTNGLVKSNNSST